MSDLTRIKRGDVIEVVTGRGTTFTVAVTHIETHLVLISPLDENDTEE